MIQGQDEHLPDEQFCTDPIDELAGIEALREEADEFRQAVTERDHLVERHP